MKLIPQASCFAGDGSIKQKGLIGLLSTLLSPDITADGKKQILEQDFHIAMTTELNQEVNEMCNYSKGIEERGIAKGIAQGISQGISQGMERISALVQRLIQDNRGGDNELAMSDIEYQKKLLAKYGL